MLADWNAMTITALAQAAQVDPGLQQAVAQQLCAVLAAAGGRDPAEIVETEGLKQVTDNGAIETAVDEIIAANPDQVAKAQQNPKIMAALQDVQASNDAAKEGAGKQHEGGGNGDRGAGRTRVQTVAAPDQAEKKEGGEVSPPLPEGGPGATAAAAGVGDPASGTTVPGAAGA